MPHLCHLHIHWCPVHSSPPLPFLLSNPHIQYYVLRNVLPCECLSAHLSFHPPIRFLSGDDAPRPDARTAPHPCGTPRSGSSRPSATARLPRRPGGGAARTLARRPCGSSRTCSRKGRRTASALRAGARARGVTPAGVAGRWVRETWVVLWRILRQLWGCCTVLDEVQQHVPDSIGKTYEYEGRDASVKLTERECVV